MPSFVALEEVATDFTRILGEEGLEDIGKWFEPFVIWVLVERVAVIKYDNGRVDVEWGVFSAFINRVAQRCWCGQNDITQVPRGIVLDVCERDVEHLFGLGPFVNKLSLLILLRSDELDDW